MVESKVIVASGASGMEKGGGVRSEFRSNTILLSLYPINIYIGAGGSEYLKKS